MVSSKKPSLQWQYDPKAPVLPEGEARRIASNIAKLPTTQQNKNRCGCLGSNAHEVGKNSQKIGSGRQGRHSLGPPSSRHHGNSGASPRIESSTH